jgi:predicted AAA+ superfamily ATPase
MHALDFEEFLWGIGIKEDMIASLRSYFENRAKVPDSINNQMLQYYRHYIATGGMPEVVQRYVDTKDYREVDTVQRSLLQGYQYDIAHYANAEEKVKAEKCYFTLSKQLLDKENHKFQYKEIEQGARAQKYYSSIEWLLRADIIHLCKSVTKLEYDLEDYSRDNFFRAYTTDLSLLISMKDYSLKQHIVENTLSGNTKGGLYECAIADALYKKDYNLYFYKNETTKKELDFIVQIGGEVVPIDVKSSNTRSNSLNSIIKKNTNIHYAYKFINGNVGVGEDGIVTLQLYMVMFL